MVDAATPNHAIRFARETDAPELARLMTALGHPTTATEVAERWVRSTTAGNGALVAVVRGGALGGVVTLHQMTVLHRPKPVGRITALIVDAPMRGRGVGRTLVGAAERMLSDAGCGLVEITSNVKWTEAHAFYAHLGYGQTSFRCAKVLESAG